MEPVIQIKNVSKKYNIARSERGYVALRDILSEIIKNPFSFAKKKIKTISDMASKEEFWALKDINLSVEKGEAIGIIGANGAGKSTLLKILTRITPPTNGEIKIKGRVVSLLEVGTGFHPELTGRENIFFNGAILGMTKKEIKRKFEQIVEFAGVKKFIDTPVKHFSSGMYVRLAFSVAAHMEPDILLVDEVLAVGDAAFQKKCLGKMDEVAKRSGRTILFVSHNMEAVRQLCPKAILLKNGKIQKYGKTDEVINHYLNNAIIDENACEYRHRRANALSGKSAANQSVELISARIADRYGKSSSKFGSTDDINIFIEYEVKYDLPSLFVDCSLFDEKGTLVFHSTDNDREGDGRGPRGSGRYISCCKIPGNLLNTGRYSVRLDARIPKIEHFFSVSNALFFQVESTGGPTSIDFPRDGIICPDLEWVTEKIV